MRVIFRIIINMEMECILLGRKSMLDNLEMGISKVKVPLNTVMVMCILEILSGERGRVKVNSNLKDLTRLFKDNSSTIKCMVMQKSCMETVTHTKVNGRRTRSMVEVVTNSNRESRCIREHGRMITKKVNLLRQEIRMDIY